MKYVKINKDHLKRNEITEEVVRVKVLLVNDNHEILLGYSYHCYQFIGGKVAKKESLLDCLRREVLEEVGILLDSLQNLEPFLLKEEYYKGYPIPSSNYNSKVYYYYIKTNQRPDISKTKYTENEKRGSFCYQYIPFNLFSKVIIDNYQKYPDAKVIGIEMLHAYQEYLKIKS